jgi:DnaA family protein
MRPEILDGLETFDLVCLDGLDAIAGNSHWETAVFNLFNGLADHSGSLVVSAGNAPAACGLLLPDLVSRLASGPVFRLANLDDAACIDALRLRADKRGFDLPVDTAEYLMRRLPRDTHTLFQFLDRLDQASLAAQRRLTIPFVRQLIEFD